MEPAGVHALLMSRRGGRCALWCALSNPAAFPRRSTVRASARLERWRLCQAGSFAEGVNVVAGKATRDKAEARKANTPIYIDFM